MKTRIVAYCRTSTENQKEDDTISIQKDAIKNYCLQNEYRLAGVFSDNGVSGSRELENRPGLSKLFLYLEAHPKVKTVIVWKLDRLARSVYMSEMLLHKLSEMSVSVVSITEGNLNNETDPFRKSFRQFLSIFAELEREFIKSRLTSGRMKKAKKGGYSGGKIPYGYKLDRKTRKLVIKESEAAAVRLIHALSKKRKSSREIAAEMSRRGILTRTGKTEWHSDTINGILKNGIYTGQYSYKDHKTCVPELKII